MPPVQRLFSPGRDTVKEAIKLVAADEKVAAAGQGAWSTGTLMVDAPVVARARALLVRAQQCGIDVGAIRAKLEEKPLSDPTVVTPSVEAADTDK